MTPAAMVDSAEPAADGYYQLSMDSVAVEFSRRQRRIQGHRGDHVAGSPSSISS